MLTSRATGIRTSIFVFFFFVFVIIHGKIVAYTFKLLEYLPNAFKLIINWNVFHFQLFSFSKSRISVSSWFVVCGLVEHLLLCLSSGWQIIILVWTEQYHLNSECLSLGHMLSDYVYTLNNKCRLAVVHCERNGLQSAAQTHHVCIGFVYHYAWNMHVGTECSGARAERKKLLRCLNCFKLSRCRRTEIVAGRLPKQLSNEFWTILGRHVFQYLKSVSFWEFFKYKKYTSGFRSNSIFHFVFPIMLFPICYFNITIQ